MRMTRQNWIQFAIFGVVSVVAFTSLMLTYIKLPGLLFGAGRYTVTVELPEAAGLYERANVTYRGTEIGRVTAVNLTDTGAEAVLSLESGHRIPADLEAQVHSQTAVGEQYVTLLPRGNDGPVLGHGDVITVEHTSVPPDINELLDATNRGLKAIPQENLNTVVDEAYLALGGLGPELSRLVRGSTRVAIDARQHLDAWTALIDHAGPVLDSQTQSSDSVRVWAANLATVTDQLRMTDADVRGVLQRGASAADEVRRLLDRVQPTLPVLLANLVSVGQVALTYDDALEQLLVLLPQGAAAMQAIGVANRNTKQDYKGANLSFNLNVNVPPPCTTGFLPARQQRQAVFEDAPDRPAGDLYCRVPQDSTLNVRGARNTPCATRPGKRAPSWQMCESDQSYVPLNDGFSWKGDPNATLSGQDIPQLPPVGTAEYEPATGIYVGPDGRTHTQSNLAPGAAGQTWQTMMLPPPTPQP
jgi:phospholipid/cholesterol/gamma-HCH transport system substrate-binding protein